MKVVIAVPDITFRGGSEKVARDIGIALRSKADVVLLSVFSGKSSPGRTDEGLKVCHLGLTRPSSAFGKIATRLRLSSHVRRELPDADIIIGNNFYRYWALPPLLNRPICVEVQHLCYEEENPSHLRLLLRDALYRCLDAVVVLTERDRKIFEDHRVINAKVLPNGVSIPSMEYTTLSRPKSVIAVGRLTAQKNFSALIEIWATIAPRIPGWSLLIYGDGDQRQMLERLVYERGLSEIVTIVGHKNDRREIFTSGSIYCSVSRFEGFQLAMYEAASYGLPIVSYDCPSGPRELFLSGDIGRLVSLDDQNGLGSALIELASDHDARARCGREARRIVEAYSFESFESRWRQYATSLLNTRDQTS